MRHFLLLAVCPLLCGSLLLLGTPSIAEEEDPPTLDVLRAERNERIERYLLRSLTQKRLNTAVEFLEAGEYGEAREKLESLKFPRLNPHERSLAYRFLAYAAIGQDDSAAAVAYFEKVIEAEGETLARNPKVLRASHS